VEQLILVVKVHTQFPSITLLPFRPWNTQTNQLAASSVGAVFKIPKQLTQTLSSAVSLPYIDEETYG